MVASASVDYSVRLWKPSSALFKPLYGHSAVVWGVNFSPDDRLIASASSDNTVKLRRSDGTFMRTIQSQSFANRGHTAAVNRVAFSRDGNIIASTSDDSTIKLWEERWEFALYFKGT